VLLNADEYVKISAEFEMLIGRNVMADIRFINPEALAKPPSYTHVVEVVGPCRTIHISGQLGTDRDSNVVGDFRAQAVQVFENLKAALAAVGASFADVVKLNSYLADIADLPVLREVRVRYLNAKALPASTTIAVSGFARPGALLEIEAVAVLPLKSARGKSSRAKSSRAKRPRRQRKLR
jgi:enamine deaminase RidA (YjgF/YER057c/UK114 family)